MFSSCRLRLIQTSGGRSPGADSNSEKWLVVELKSEALDEYLTERRFYEWLGEGSTIWGKYSIKANHTRNDFDPSFYIGQGEPKKEPKIWRYKPGELSIYFGTIKTNMVGGGLEFGETTSEVRDDLVLYKTNPLGAKVMPSDNSPYSNGFVNVPSWIQPFRRGTLYWMPNDITLSR